MAVAQYSRALAAQARGVLGLTPHNILYPLLNGLLYCTWKYTHAYFCPSMGILTLPSVDCGSPVAPQRGSLESYTTTTEGSEVSYRCNQGLVPETRMRAVCTRNGWSPNPAVLNCNTG